MKVSQEGIKSKFIMQEESIFFFSPKIQHLDVILYGMAFLSQFTPSTLTGRPATMPGDASGTSMVMRKKERVPAHVEWPFNWASEVASQASR